MKISITDFNPMDPSECFQVYNIAAAAAAYFGADSADQIVRGAKTAPQDSGLVADIQEDSPEEADELPPVYLRTPVPAPAPQEEPSAPAENSAPAPQEEPSAPAENSAPAPQEEPSAPAENSAPAPQEEPSAPAESSAPAPQEEPEEPPPPPLPRAREVMEPPEVEAHVKEVKKPRSKLRPERAKVFEAPGECLHCGLVACTDVGWFCKPQFRGLPVDAKKCKKFAPGKPEGMSEPEPPAESTPAQQTPPAAAAPPAESSAPAQQTPPPAAPPAESTPAQQTPPTAAAAPVDDPEAFFNQNPDDGMDAKTMRDTIRRQARECLQNPEIRKTFPTFIRQFTETGQINDIPDDKLKPCLTALRQAAADAGKKGGQGNLAV